MTLKLKESKYYQDCLRNQSLEFGEFFFFDKFVVGEIHEEAIMDFAKAEYLLDVIEKFYKGKVPHYYISNKIFSYSVDPSLWAKLAPRIKNLNYLIIEETASAKINTTFEKMFFEGQLLKFPSLEQALEWVLRQVKSGNKSIGSKPKGKFYSS